MHTVLILPAIADRQHGSRLYWPGADFDLPFYLSKVGHSAKNSLLYWFNSSTTLNLAFPLIMRSYACCAWSKGNFSIIGRTPV